MSTRIIIQSLPYDLEGDAYPIANLEIFHEGEVRNLGFGHSIGKYSYRMERCGTGSFMDDEMIYQGEIPEHDFRDGVLELVRKALAECESL